MTEAGSWEPPPRSRDRSRSRSKYSKSMVWAQVLAEGPTYPQITALHRQASDSGVSEWWERTPESVGSGAYAVLLLEMAESMQDSQRVRSTTTGSRVRRRVGSRGPLDPAGLSGAVLAAPSPSGSGAEPGLLIARRRPRPAGCDTPAASAGSHRARQRAMACHASAVFTSGSSPVSPSGTRATYLTRSRWVRHR
jgi:hypothetical protein